MLTHISFTDILEHQINPNQKGYCFYARYLDHSMETLHSILILPTYHRLENGRRQVLDNILIKQRNGAGLQILGKTT